MPRTATKRTRYSITRAIHSMAEPSGRLTGLEREVHDEVRQHYGLGNDAENILRLPWGNEPTVREMLGLPDLETRGDLTTSTGTGAVFVRPGGLVDLLRAKLVLARLGAMFIPTDGEKFSLPRTTGSVTAAWITEGSSLTSQNESLDMVPFIPRTLGGAVLVSRKFAYQSTMEADAYVTNDLARTLAVAVDAAGINGSGSGAVPVGLLQNTAIQALNTSNGLSLGASGGALTRAALLALEDVVAEANAEDSDNLGFLTAPKVRKSMRSIPEVSTFPRWLWETGAAEYGKGFGKVLGLPAQASTNVPTGLSKGSSSSLGALIYGAWNNLVIATSGPPSVLINPYSNALNGAIQITCFVEADINCMHAESFCFYSDVNYS